VNLALRVGAVSLAIIATGCADSSPTRPMPPPTVTTTPTAAPTPTGTPIPCANLAGSYDLDTDSGICTPAPIPVPFGTAVVQEGCAIRFALRVGSGHVSGQIRGGEIDFVWTDRCEPALVGTGGFEPQPGGRYRITGRVARQPNGSCCTQIDFALTPR